MSCRNVLITVTCGVGLITVAVPSGLIVIVGGGITTLIKSINAKTGINFFIIFHPPSFRCHRNALLRL